ncbi:META domain-containing protein [Bradyrhizobium sp.]|uniref:META domain-containing protein n=1 Tax=Bradyrhizobium sp. TaxID=376 RepID=UPI003C6FD1FF
MEMMLEAPPQPGSKRIPDLDIGDNGETVLELWCKGGKGQFSVAGNTVIFVPGPLEDRSCPPARAQADDELVAALSQATTWKRQGDLVAFIGAKTLRFRLNTN